LIQIVYLTYKVKPQKNKPFKLLVILLHITDKLLCQFYNLAQINSYPSITF